MSSTSFLRRVSAWLAPAALSLLALGSAAAQAQEDPPGRVGRLSELQGQVSWYDHEQGAWAEAERNRPLTGGDRLSTGPQARAELRVGSTVLRLGAGSELEVLRLDDERMAFQLHAGSLALRVRSREVASEIEVATAEARFRPERSGHYRFDRIDDTTQACAWRGTLRIDDSQGFILETGQRVELWRERSGLKFSWAALPGDAFAGWVLQDEQRDEQRTASSRYVSPEMTGAEDLDRAGRWERHPDYGPIWYPVEVRPGWAPYRYGRWAWVQPWGWTWVDEAPWGFAPFHYGRWVNWGGRWGWCPGDYVARPVYAPALVAWIGGPRVGVSVTIGGPTVGWVPLAPREWYVPYYRYSPVYIDRVNPRPPNYRGDWQRPRYESSVTITYSNQNVQGGVTVVSRDVLNRREYVGRGAMDAIEVHRALAQQPVQVVPAPVRDAPTRIGPPPPRIVTGQPVTGERRERDGRDDRGGRGDREERGRDRDRTPPPVMPAQPAPQMVPQAAPQPMPQAAPQQQPQQAAPIGPQRQPMPPREREREREREQPAAQQPMQPAPQPQVQQPQRPAPAAAPAMALPPAAAPQQAPRPMAPAPAPAPAAQPAPQATPATAGPPPRRPPTSPDERARERERERDQRDEERKRAPDNRGQRPERENQR